MKKPQIVFLCHFSNPMIRERLELKSYIFVNRWLKYRHKPPITYDDFAIWVSDYIEEFEKHSEVEIHIIAPHKGMKRSCQDFFEKGIYYHFFRCDGNYFADAVKTHLHLFEKNDYLCNRLKIRRIIERVVPNILLLCGAESPYYSIAALDIKSTPIYVILQTLLNDPKRIAMGVGSPYRRNIEEKIFRHAQYFCTSGENEIKTIKAFNNNARILPAGFPTHRPVVTIPKDKQYDFVFFARGITKNKGIEDLLKALAIVKRIFSKVSLNVIGGCASEYKEKLDELIIQLKIQENVHFSGYYNSIDDTFANVAKASVVVVPGITAGLNSTVRESMFLGLPTICYETNATRVINKDKICLLTAPINNTEDLARQMIWTINNQRRAQKIADNGKEYAELIFSNAAIVNNLLLNCQKIIDREV